MPLKLDIITKAGLIANVAERWAQQYPTKRHPAHTEHGAIRNMLRREPPETAEEVAAIIGNDSWTRLTCDVCETSVEAVVTVPFNSCECVAVCQSCVVEMARKLSEATS